MSKTTTQAVTSQQPDGPHLAMIDIAKVKPRDGFNPRRKRETGKYKRLRGSVARRGIRQPLMVTPDPENDGEFWIVAGEGRYLAATEAQLPQVPCLIDAVDSETEGLDDSLIENMVREDLSPMDEARAFKRLRDGGLRVVGIAERIERPQKFVRERLALLELPEGLHDQIDSGAVPLGAVPALLALGKIHPELPAVGVRRVFDPPANSWDEPTTWDDLSANPVSVVIGTVPDHYAQLPDGVYVAGHSYPIAGLPLDKKAQADLVKLGELQGIDIDSAEVRFGRELVEQAGALSAAFASKDGYEHLIVGADVAGQLVGDQIIRRLKDERARRRENAADSSASNAGRGDEGDGAAAVDAGAGVSAAVSEEHGREQAKREREEAKETQRQARAYNLVLGIQLTKHLSRVKVDERVLRVLTAAPLANELEKIAARGARLTFPGWSTETERKNGSIKVDYLDTHKPGHKAREYLEGASTAGEVAGRALALLAAARWADERAVAKSRRSFYELHFERMLGVPWSSRAGELLDELLIEKLSPEATAPIREAKHKRETARAEQQRQDADRDRAVAALMAQAPTLTRAARTAEISRVCREHGFTAIDRATLDAINAHPEPGTPSDPATEADPAQGADATSDRGEVAQGTPDSDRSAEETEGGEADYAGVEAIAA